MKFSLFQIVAALFFAGAMHHALAQEAPAAPAPAKINVAIPRIWIFNGTPGDQEHHVACEKNLASLRKSLTERYAVPKENITVLYGPKSEGYDGPCTREALLAELGKVVTHLAQPNPAPVWLIFLGHANPITGGTLFNLPGPDVSVREIGEALKPAAASAPLVVLATTACSADFMKVLSGLNRFVITATIAGDPESETDFPTALSEALASPASDSNQDKILSVTELFQAANAGVLRIYKEEDLIINEHAQLDGNGDGKGTQRPSPEDAIPASGVGLAIGEAKKFE